MTLDSLLHSWTGIGLRHIPTSAGRGILDGTHAARSRRNRWNEAGTPTFYFASDISVVVAEFGRHIRAELPGGDGERQARDVWRVPLSLSRLIDFRDPAAAGSRKSISRLSEIGTRQTSRACRSLSPPGSSARMCRPNSATTTEMSLAK